MTKVSALWAPPVPRRVPHFQPPLPEVGILTYPNELEKNAARTTAPSYESSSAALRLSGHRRSSPTSAAHSLRWLTTAQAADYSRRLAAPSNPSPGASRAALSPDFPRGHTYRTIPRAE